MRFSLLALCVVLVPGCPTSGTIDGGADASFDGASIDARGTIDAPVDGSTDDAPSRDAPIDGAAAADAPIDDDAGCVPTATCELGESTCIDASTARRCTEVRPCELDWTSVTCPSGETCGLRLDGHQDCGRPEVLTCENDVVPTFDFRCRTMGDSYCTADHFGMWVCGQSDGDACLEAIFTACADDETCPTSAFGACTCIDRCTLGALRCGEDLVSEERCEDGDGDGCREWRPVRACPSGQTCLASSGTCSSTCADDCITPSRGCYRTPPSVGECGNFDADGCRDFRRIECPRARPICDVGSVSCVGCIGGIECGPEVEVCVAGTCTPPPGTCFRGSGDLVTIPAGAAAGDVTLFVGVRLPTGGPLFGTGFLHHPDGTIISIDLSTFRDGYVDSIFDTVDATSVPALAALGTRSPAGVWSFSFVSEGPPATREQWAICIAP